MSTHQIAEANPRITAKDLMGRLVVSVNPGRCRQLYRNPNLEAMGLVDRAILFHLRQRALKENRTRFLERLHQSFWSGSGGEVFSRNCDHRFQDLFLAKQRPDFAALRNVWEELGTAQIVEVGTNSGLLLQFLTANLPEVTSAVGIDINKVQIEANEQSDAFDSRVEFVHGYGDRWIAENASSNTLFVSNGGVLEYFSRTRLDKMLTHIRENCAPAIFYASEPVARDFDFSKAESVAFGDELSFSHNYLDLFESNGFRIVHNRSVEFEEWTMMTTISICEPA